MNSFMNYGHGTLASAYFEHYRRTDADFRRNLYDSRIAMYKTSYERDFHWPERALKSGKDPCAFGTREGTRTTNYDPKQTEDDRGFATIPKLTDDEFVKLYTPKSIVFRKLSDNKRIVPPLEYSKGAAEESRDSADKRATSLYQDTYNVVNRPPCSANGKEETPEEWAQRWKNGCQTLRDADDVAEDWSRQVVNAQRILLNRKRIGRV